jgi:hypothetical protein
MVEDLMNVIKSLENRITCLEMTEMESIEIKLIKQMSGALDEALKYSERLEERIAKLELAHKLHVTKTNVHGFK